MEPAEGRPGCRWCWWCSGCWWCCFHPVWVRQERPTGRVERRSAPTVTRPCQPPHPPAYTSTHCIAPPLSQPDTRAAHQQATSPSQTLIMFAARRLPLVPSYATRRLFHASAPAFVRVGDKLPDVDLVEDSPGNKVNLAKELTGKGLIIGTSTPNCSHLPRLTPTQASRLHSHPLARRATSPATSTRPNSRMPARSLLCR